MNYKFIKVTSYYQSVLNYFYEKTQDAQSKSYDELLNLLHSEAFGWGNFFQINLNKLGNDAYEIVYNADLIQAKWAREYGLKVQTREEIFFQQLKKIQPEVLFLQDISPFTKSFIEHVRSEIRSIKLIIEWLCAPYAEKQKDALSVCDFVCSCSELFINEMNSYRIKAYRLNHAFETSLLPNIENSNKPQVDFLFVGSFFPGSEFHNTRLQIIEALLAEDINIKLFTQLPQVSNIPIKKTAYFIYQLLKKYNLENIGKNIPQLKKMANYKEPPAELKLSDKFMKAVDNTPLFGIEMLRAFSKAKVGFNSHGGVAGDYASNIRLFEVTGSGSCLLTDYKKNISEFFVPDKEIVTYNSVEECIEKTKWLLNHPNETKEIANAGQQRTLHDHTFYNRAAELDSIIQKELTLKK